MEEDADRGSDEDEIEVDGDGIPDSFKACKLFRRLAKRAKALPAAEPDELEEPDGQLERTELIENLWDIGSELEVWIYGIGESVALAICCLYAGRDTEAFEVLNHLADEELRRLQAGEEEEEEAEGEPE